MKTSAKKRVLEAISSMMTVLIICCFCILCEIAFSQICPSLAGNIVYAGLGENNEVEDAVSDPWMDSGDPVVEASKVHMTPGETYDISTFKKATWLLADKPGTYKVTGESTKTMMEILADPNGEITIIFDNTRMVATKDCPGVPTARRSAIKIHENRAGTVRLVSAAGSKNYFRAKGGEPCIKKDSLNQQLIFDTEDQSKPGTIEVHADPNAVKTSAIGCYSDTFIHNTFGNVTFEAGIVIAYGSTNGKIGGGPGIGADFGGTVDGITFNNATVEAYAGGGSSAAIGTSSGEFLFGNMQSDCRNITINGGVVKGINTYSEADYHYGGAGIGGGAGSSAINIKIHGGEVTGIGTLSAAGIGGGDEGDGIGIEITGGKVFAGGGSSGIGSGWAHDNSGKDDSRYGDCQIKISQDDPDVETVVEAYGGYVYELGFISAGVGIGGWKNRFYAASSNEVPGKRSIEITGGTVKAIGHGEGAGIGAGQYGYIRDIKISGGIISATGGDYSVAIGGYNKHEGQASCGTIRISGGTILAGDGKGTIGGPNYKNSSYNEYDPTRLIITGGNIHAEAFLSSPVDDNKVKLACSPISIETFSFGYNRNKRHPVESFQMSLGDEVVNKEYGMNDVYTFPTSDDSVPTLYFWIPEDDATRSVKTKDMFMNRGLAQRSDDIRFFKGANPPALNSSDLPARVYPQYYFLFDDNYYEKDTGKDSAMVYIGEKNASTIENEIRTAGDTIITPKYYSLDKEGKKPILNPDGTFIKNVEDEHTIWTDGEGRLLMDAKEGESKAYSKDNPDWWKNGIRLWAIWDKYELTYNGNKPISATTELSGDMSSTIHAYSETITIKECGYTLPGYAFTGWLVYSDAQGSDKIYHPGDKVKGSDLKDWRDGSITLYAQWEPKAYEVKLHSVNPYGLSTVTCTFDSQNILPTIAELGWASDNKKFHGWTRINQLGSLYPDGANIFNFCTFTGSGDPVGWELNAEWVLAEQIIVSVTENNSPVSGMEKCLMLTDDNDVQYYIPAIYLDGRYILDPSQASTAFADPAQLPPGDYRLCFDTNFDPAVSKEFQPAYAEITYGESSAVSVVFEYYTVTMEKDEHIDSAWVSDSEGAYPPAESLHVLKGTKINVQAETGSGYHFDGYSVIGITPAGFKSLDPDAAIQSGLPVYGEAHIIAHAQANVYTILFDPNDGTGSMENQDMVYDEPQNLFVHEFSRSGYIFSSWNIKPDGSGVGFDDHTLINKDNQSVLAPDKNGGTVILYAIWEPVTYGIEYDLGQGYMPPGEDNPVTYTIETEDFTLVNPVSDDYCFEGWTGTDLKNPKKDVTIEKGSTGDRNYTANWKIKEYKVTFETNGGSEVKSQTVKIHQRVKKPADPEKIGYAFTDWYADKSLTELYDFDKEITEDIKIYAAWEPVAYCIEYDLGQGHLPSGKKNPATYTIESESFTLENPESDDYSFEGWTGTDLKKMTKTVAIEKGSTGNRSYKANWKIKEYKVSFETNGGSMVKPQTVKIHQKAKKPADPKRSGYTFRGWFSDKSLKAEFDFNTGITEDTIIYAKWIRGPVNVLIGQGKPSGKRSIKTSWNKIAGAKKYVLYGASCGSRLKRITSTTKKGFNVKKIRNKKLTKHSPYKFVVVALDKRGNVLATSKPFHVITANTMGKYSNIKSIKADKKRITLEKGESVIVGAKYKLPKGKRHINGKHGAQLRYTSNNPGIATVDKNGKVKTKDSGIATIYIQDTCGKYCKTYVMVK